MEHVNEDIKKEFDDKIKSIEEIDTKKIKLINILCYVATIFLFISVLVSTVLSISNYMKAKQKQENVNQPVVVQLKKIN